TTAKSGDGDTKGGDDTKAPPKEEKKKKPNGWAKLPIGTILETKTVSKITVPKMETESVTVYTLKDRNDTEATVNMETKTKAQGKDLPAVIKDQQFPLFADPVAELQSGKEKPAEAKDEIDVKGVGKVACTKYTVRSTAFGVEKSRTETWLDASGEIPVPIKYVTQTMANNTTVTLTSVKRPGDAPPK